MANVGCEFYRSGEYCDVSGSIKPTDAYVDKIGIWRCGSYDDTLYPCNKGGFGKHKELEVEEKICDYKFGVFCLNYQAEKPSGAVLVYTARHCDQPSSTKVGTIVCNGALLVPKEKTR